jgi:hypothetical protein
VFPFQISAQVEKIDSVINEIKDKQTLIIKDSLLNNLSSLSKDSLKRDVRLFDKADIEKYKADATYEYEKIVPKDISFWDRLKMWLFRKLLQREWGENDGKYITNTIYAITAIIVLWAIIKLAGMDVFSLFYLKNNTKNELTGEWLNDNIHVIDFEKQIAEAIAKKDYKISVRLFYLFTLKKLTDKKLIDWEINKTNHEYSLELLKTVKGHQIRQDFEQATYYFEYVWYGDFKVNEEQFAQAQELYQQFMKRI